MSCIQSYDGQDVAIDSSIWSLRSHADGGPMVRINWGLFEITQDTRPHESRHPVYTLVRQVECLLFKQLVNPKKLKNKLVQA